MPLVPIRYPAMFGGVSEQPPHLRYPGQVEAADNARIDLVDGISKRPGTWFVREVCGGLGVDNVRLHPINRDQDEKYLVLYGDGVLRVLQLGAMEAAVQVSTAAANYLSGATADDLRLVTVADYTLILNTTKVPGTTLGATFSVSGTWADYDRMVAHTPADDTYHQATAATAAHEAGYYHYDVGGVTYSTIRFAAVSGRELADPVGQWNNAASSPFTFRIRFRKRALAISGGTFTFATLRLTSTGAFAGYTWQAEDRIQITASTAGVVVPAFYKIASKLDDDTLVLTAHADLTANSTGVATEGICTEHDVSFPTTGADTSADMYGVAARMQTALHSAGAADALCEWTSNGYQAGYFTITSPYRSSDATCYPPVGTGAGTNLAAAGQAFDGTTGYTVTAGTGAYTTSVLTVDERWTQVPAPGLPDGDINASTMPLKMRRLSVGTSVSAGLFDVDVIDWTARADGDELTNPAPSIFTNGVPIEDMGFFRDRLWLLAGENIVGSQAGDLFNFYQQDATNEVDSDPIDVPLSSDEVTLTEFAVPFRDGLSIFTKAGRQFELTGGDTLTPASHNVTATTSYATHPVRPVVLGDRLYFLGTAGCETQLLEYRFDYQSVANDATDVTAHVPTLLPETPRSLVADSNARVAFVLPVDSNELFVYAVLWAGDEKKISAWTRYEFDDGYTVSDIAVLDSHLYLLVRWSGGWCIERLALARESACCTIDGVIPC